MLKKAVLVTSVFLSSLVAQTIDEIYNRVLTNNQTLKSLETSIQVASKGIELSTKWQNPILTFGANDIQFDDVSKRDLEPMQAEYIGFSQLIPVGNKLELQKKIAQKQTNIAKYTLEDKRLELKSKIYEYAYSIKVLEKKYELLIQYQKNIKSLEKLSTALYEHGKMRQVDLMRLKVSYSNIELKKEDLKNMIKNLYLKLEEITYTPINSIDTSLNVQKVIYDERIDTHPKILMIQEKYKQLKTLSQLERAKKNSDVKLNVAYFSRDSKYEDYANISVSIPLSFYDIENTKSVQAKMRAQEVEEKVMDIKHSFTTSIRTLQNSLNSAIIKYEILRDAILPIKNRIQKNLETYNSLNQIRPQETIKSLNEIINYELKSLDELNDYYRVASKLQYFVKDLRYEK